jgi:hypothetical protein
MHTIKLNITDKVYVSVVEALKKFKGDVTIIENIDSSFDEWQNIDNSEVKKTMQSIKQMQEGKVIDHKDVINKHRLS